MSTIGARLSSKALRTRWFVRAPIGLYRAGLGIVFGVRLLMLEHIGRSSGARRYVVLEVVDHPETDRYVVVSGFGPRAQWYRNIEAEPRVRVSIGLRRSIPAIATPMSKSESDAALARYAQRHPRAWRKLRAAIEHAVGHPVDTLPMVSLRLGNR
ncbi:nitroreductase family deazaflavin-dependent oxidoreductase [Nocardia panacis]|uniref:Nitroreductase family deazaflavin-dependent oxidoreductase n=1 Tax=Nocardia panacis TaxID=2340916 RepID=A0A3A4K122_9NOCA|nr:nitroreductase family deazaflavin-dependent oxidoreductase [Nocardia panacis]RJO73410.1 nitroreductase family deazaflavin-dependent oxidoreductase [Nocardia panacis]